MQEDLSEVQLKRRQLAIEAILSKFFETTGQRSFQVVPFLMEAYNAGFTDAQNETKDAFKLSYD